VIVLRAAALAAIVATCVFAQPRGKWMRIDDSEERHTILPVENCRSLAAQSTPIDRGGKVETRFIGTIRNMQVYDVIENLVQEDYKVWTRRVLVERAKDQFCEIYRINGDFINYLGQGDSSIITVNSGQILRVEIPKAGTMHSTAGAYWVFDDGGPIELNLAESVGAAVEATLPKDRLIQRSYGLDLARMCYLIEVWTPQDPACCGSAGTVFIKFALNGTSLVATEKEYDPTNANFAKHEKECPRN
jgi:hypothetical protein